MKPRSKIFGLLPILLCSPTLMAITISEVDSISNFDKNYIVIVEAIDDESCPNTYKFTINNIGDCYLDKRNIYSIIDGYNLSDYYYQDIYQKDSLKVIFNQLIKPKEIFETQIQFDSSINITEGEFTYLDYSIDGFLPASNIFTITAPYTCSFTEESYRNVLTIDCSINQKEEIISTDDSYYNCLYAVTLQYGAEKYCALATGSGKNKISMYFNTNIQIEPEDIFIEEIDCFVDVAYPMCCEPMDCDGDKIIIKDVFKCILIGLTILGIPVIIISICCLLNSDNRKLKNKNPNFIK